MKINRYTQWFSLILAVGILTFLVGGSSVLPGAVVHADSCSSNFSSSCTIGPNLELLSVTGALYSGSGPCTEGAGGSSTFVDSATNPGIDTTDNPVICATPTSANASQTGTIVVEALNGYEFDDFSFSVGCGVTGNNSLTFSGTASSGGTSVPFSQSCMTEQTVGATSTLSGEDTFTPVTTLTLTTTLTDTATPGGTTSLSFADDNFSLVTTPEPSSSTLLFIGLVGLFGVARKRLLRS